MLSGSQRRWLRRKRIELLTVCRALTYPTRSNSWGIGGSPVVHLTNGLEAILLQIVPVGKVADGPSERIAEVNVSSDYWRAAVS